MPLRRYTGDRPARVGLPRSAGSVRVQRTETSFAHVQDNVSAEIGWTGNNNALLRARATAIGPWEKFRIPRGAYNGEWTTIRSLADSRYVSAEIGSPSR